MIALTRLNGRAFVVNAEMIKFIEATPDTMLTLERGDHVMVQESLDEVIERATEYARRIRAFQVA